MPYENWSENATVIETNQWFLWTDFVHHFRKLRNMSFTHYPTMIRDHVMVFARDYPDFSEEVTEYNRFPFDAIYINAAYLISSLMMGLMRAADVPKPLPPEEVAKAKEKYYEILEKIFDVIDTTETHKLIEYGCFDQEAFERKYNLSWVD
jgi:hypothetical protein